MAALLHGDHDRYGVTPGNPLVEAVHSQLHDLVRRKLADSGGDWLAFVFGTSDELVTAEDIAAIEGKILGSGHRFAWSAMISVQERPEAYQPGPGSEETSAIFSFEHGDAPVGDAEANGRQQRGIGDNVVRREANAIGTARYVRTSSRVIAFMKEGIPPGTIAIIDDSGGTLTAPILEGFAGVICAGGTVRSHLGILTREYNIPCVMNARISGIREGDRVEIETTAEARTAESYQSDVAMPARIWKLPV